MLEKQFFKTEPVTIWESPTESIQILDTELLQKLRVRAQPGDDDLESTIELCKLLIAEYRKFGTGRTAELRIDDNASRVATAALKEMVERQGVEWSLPWSDFPTFKTYWYENGCHGNYQARRNLINRHFSTLLDTLEDKQVKMLRKDLAVAVSPRSELGWPKVDEALKQLRDRFATATTTADYKDVGNRCVGVLEALSAFVYDPKIHLPEGEVEPAIDKTYVRIGAYIGDRLPGKPNEKLRALCKKASELAHSVKHSPKADRTTSGIAADSVILLANILRRLEE